MLKFKINKPRAIIILFNKLREIKSKIILNFYVMIKDQKCFKYLF